MSTRRIIQDCQRLNSLCLSTIVRTSSSTADLATSNECAESIPLMHPYAIPLIGRNRGLLLVRGFMSFRVLAPPMTAITRNAWPIIQSMNWRRPRSSRSWSRLCAGSPIAPKTAMSTAPAHTRIVPPSDHLVNGSPRMRVAHIELKTRPD